MEWKYEQHQTTSGQPVSGLTSTETGSAISWVPALGLSFLIGNMRRLLKGFLADIP